jgi:hypothetical protein
MSLKFNCNVPLRFIQLVAADLVAPSHEKKSGHDGRDVDSLHNRQHNVPAKQAIDQK